jgi:hypothetical protein
MIPLSTTEAPRDPSCKGPFRPQSAQEASIENHRSEIVYKWVSRGFALLLLIAAGLKAQAFSAKLEVGTPFWERFILIFVVATVWLLGGWILLGICTVWARRAALALLSIFIMTAAWRLLSLERDCGCFGKVEMHPAWMLSMDLVFWMSLWRLGRHATPEPDRDTPRWFRFCCAICVSVSAPIGGALLGQAEASRETVAHENLTILEPESWRGQPLPLLGFINASARAKLSSGRWTVIVIDGNCRKCTEYLSRSGFLAQRFEFAAESMLGGIVAIDIAEYRTDASVLHLRIPVFNVSPGTHVVARGPFEVAINDGKVSDTRSAE